MRDVDHRIRLQRRTGWRHQQRTAWTTEGFNDRFDLLGDGFQRFVERLTHGAEFVQLRRAPDSSRVEPLVGEALEERFGDFSASLVGKLVVDLVAVLRERVRQAPDLFVVGDVERFVIAAVFLPVIPGAHERVLKDRQLVGVVPDVVEQTLDKARGHRRAADGHRAFDSHLALRARHPGHQELAVVDSFRQIPELRTIAQIVGAHRQYDVDGHVLGSGRFEQQFDEGRRVVAGLHAFGLRLEPEEFLELIDDDEQVFALRHPGLFGHVDQAQRAPTQGGFEDGRLHGDTRLVGGTEEGEFIERPGQCVDGVAAGPE